MIRDLSIKLTEIEKLCTQFSVHRLELFGSGVTNEDLPAESDLDFLAEFKSVAPGRYADNYLALREALEELFGRPIDLVVASAIKNPYFRQSIDRSRKLLYAA